MKRSPFITILIKQQSIVLACAEYFSNTHQLTSVLIKELAPNNTFVGGRIFNFELAFSTIAAYLHLMRYDKALTGIIFDASLITNHFGVSYENEKESPSSLGSYHVQTLTFAQSSDEVYTYTARIGCDLVLQYELLCNAVGLQLIFISTPFQACVQAYKELYGAAFRQSLLFDAITQHGTDLDRGINQSLVARLIKQTPSQVNGRDNLLCVGSFYCMKDLLV